MNEFIRFISKDDQEKAFILIDELDRCRPSYAIEMLEIIKHFFDTPNFVFVVATDTQQLSHSIKAVYGSSFDGEEYLTRFFNRTASIPKGDLSGFIKGLLEKTKILENLNVELAIPNFTANSHFGAPVSKVKLNLEELSSNLMLISEVYAISLRKLEQAIAKLDSILLFENTKPPAFFDYQILFQLIIESNSNLYSHVYKERKFKRNIGKLDFLLSEETKTLINSKAHKGGINRSLVKSDLHNVSYDNEYNVSYDNEYDSEYLITKLNVSLAFMQLSSGRITFKDSSLYPDRLDTQEDIIKSYQASLASHVMSNPQVYIWSPEDYFSKVELAASLT